MARAFWLKATVVTRRLNSRTLPEQETGLALARASLSRRQLFAVVSGNALEFYDFLTYAFFAVSIGRAFFPAGSPFVSLMLSLTAFGVGFLGRPLGAIFIGRYGDRVGRLAAMRLSLILMGIGTAGLISIPSYQAIGLFAPVLVLVSRVVQGFALGGESGPATAFLIEAAPCGKRGRYGAWQVLSQNLASIAAGIVGVVLSNQLSPTALTNWGWRLAFLPGLLVVPASLYLRETLPVNTIKPTSDIEQELWDRVACRTIRAGLALASAVTASTYALLYFPTYATTTLRLHAQTALAAPLVVGVATIATGWPAAMLSDKLGRRPVICVGWALLLVSAWPTFSTMVAQPSAVTFLGGVALLSVCYAVATIPSIVFFAERIPRSRRSALIATIYAAAVTIFGSLTHPVLAWCTIRLNAGAPGFFIAICAVVALIAAYAMPEKQWVD